ncbi:MAG: tetratricopeptide repeat protein [Armatimonadetes bacterium]|nr:tetratricopeptide repeat protein [Armatimonadota bacterium]
MESHVVQRLAARALGIELSDTQAGDAAKKIGPLLTLCGCDSLAAFEQRFPSLTAEERDQFTALITNNETYFFREPHQFAFVVEGVLGPYLISAKQDVHLRILSLGCAKGEEPYSIAMILHDFFVRFPFWKLEIRALDVNPFNLRQAKQATYPKQAFRQPLLDKAYQERFFARIGEHWLLSPVIRNRVRFEEGNFSIPSFCPDWEGSVDVVFFRNVCMYFDESTRNSALDRISKLLREGGYLIVASQEVPLLAQITSFSSVETGYGYVLQKSSHKTPRPARVVVDKKVPAAVSKILNPVPLLSPPTQRLPRSPSTSRSLDGCTCCSRSGTSPCILARMKLIQAAEHFDREEFPDTRSLLGGLSGLSCVNPYSWLLLAHLNLNENKIEKAEEYLKNAIERDSLIPEAYFIQGLVRRANKHVKEAEEMFRKALFLSPDFWPAKVFLGDLLRQQGLWEGARNQYQTALSTMSSAPLGPIYQAHWKETLEGAARRGLAIMENENRRESPGNPPPTLPPEGGGRRGGKWRTELSALEKENNRGS